VVSRRIGTGPWADNYRTVVAGALKSLVDAAAPGNPTTASYTYTVKACNAAGCSAATAEAAVPHAPVNLQIATPIPGNQKIHLSWSPGPGSSYTGYRVFRVQGACASSTGWVMVKAVGAARVTWVDEEVTTGQWSYKVQGFKASGTPAVSRGFSWYSNCAAATVV
jgi:hypothetical protein